MGKYYTYCGLDHSGSQPFNYYTQTCIKLIIPGFQFGKYIVSGKNVSTECKRYNKGRENRELKIGIKLPEVSINIIIIIIMYNWHLYSHNCRKLREGMKFSKL